MLSSRWHSLYETSQSVTLEEQGQTPVRLNHRLDKVALISGQNANWHPSPTKGVKRLMLERDGGEKTLRATSIVAYQPGSQFTSHSHPLGEEFLVLAGTFSDENGDYPAGTYVRNPPGSSHTPYSTNGCMIWVKLQQFKPDDTQQVVTRLPDEAGKFDTAQNGILSKTLFADYELVQYQKALEDAQVEFNDTHRGIEILLLNGTTATSQQNFKTGSWLRFPAGHPQTLKFKQNTSWLLKTGHLG